MPVLVITGATRGLGLEFVRQYAAEGWDVVAINRGRSEELDALAKDFPVQLLRADLTDDDSLRDAVAQITQEKVDLLINNAGTMGDSSMADAGLQHQAFGTFNRAEWLRVFDINVCTPMALAELLVGKLAAAQNPLAVTLSSILGSNELNTVGNFYGYRASKAAVNSIMRSMGINLKDRGITCVALHPGWARTDMGGPAADLDATESVRSARRTIAGLTLDDAGRFLAWDGKAMPY
ncbi:MAG: NAD(P)-dependent dehydrogenase (short-subunit alcohol dehydrogenase family) [Halieaceae bacterium]|jgi:NAD(P)-dependent dehydrogenase (short-subunit alcohol dehydrogenase family)